MRIAIYARVSKALDQNPENQLIQLREYANRCGHEIEGEYIDERSSRDTRPAKEAVLKKLRLGEIDGVAISSLDRWGRNMKELVLEIDEFSNSSRSIISLREGLDLTTTAGRLAGHIFAAMANFERELIRERTLLGLARARAQGKKLGRPRKAKGRTALVNKVLADPKALDRVIRAAENKPPLNNPGGEYPNV